ncbi:MAG: PqqD family peptide modification chaperone [Bacteroidota bacterium]|nr:PqqD family peptide modification chaperone [Bacteroidota bacterium]
MKGLYYRNSQIIDGELDNNQVMMHIEKGKYYGLNPVGKRIWELVEQPRSFEDIVAVLLSEFNVSEEQCREEVKAFLEKGIKCDILNTDEAHS